MNTVIASFFLVLFFTVNGMTMHGGYPTAPLMLLGRERGTPTDRSNQHPKENSYYDHRFEEEERQQSENQTRSRIASSERDQTYSDAPLRAWRERSPMNSADTKELEANGLTIKTDLKPTDDLLALCLAKHKKLNELETTAKIGLTPLPSEFPTPIAPPSSYSSAFASSSDKTRRLYGKSRFLSGFPRISPVDGDYQLSFLQSRSSDDNHIHFLTPDRHPNHQLTIHRPSRLPNFYDSLHFVKIIPTIFGDTPISTAAVAYFFNIDPKYGIPAWFFGNLLGSIVGSHSVIRAIESLSPEPARAFVKGFLSPSEPLNYLWNPGYFFYYATAWSIMGMDKTFNVTPFQAASFMILSGAIRQIADQVINKKNPLSWNTKTWRPEVRNPFSWNKENIDSIACSPRSQLWRASWEYLPDVIGAAARSGSSHIPTYWQGTETVDVIIPKVMKSTAVYTGGLTSYYPFYRLIEHLSRSHYKEASEMNQRMLKRLYNNIQRAARYGISVPLEERKSATFIKSLSTLGESKPLLESSDTIAKMLTPIRPTPARATPPRNLNKSSSSRKLISHPISREALLASLKVLRSHLISYFKDPIFYRIENPFKDAPSPFKEAYSIIDLLEMYKAHITDDKTILSEIEDASRTLLAALKRIRLRPEQVETLLIRRTEHPDIENNQSSSDCELKEIPFHDILPLLHLFDRYAGTNPSKDKLPASAAELTPLRRPESGNSYGATLSEKAQKAPTQDDMFSDDSDLDDGWAPR